MEEQKRCETDVGWEDSRDDRGGRDQVICKRYAAQQKSRRCMPNGGKLLSNIEERSRKMEDGR